MFRCLSNTLLLNKAVALPFSEGASLLLGTAAFSVVTAVSVSVLNEGLWPASEDSSESEERQQPCYLLLPNMNHKNVEFVYFLCLSLLSFCEKQKHLLKL